MKQPKERLQFRKGVREHIEYKIDSNGHKAGIYKRHIRYEPCNGEEHHWTFLHRTKTPEGQVRYYKCSKCHKISYKAPTKR